MEIILWFVASLLLALAVSMYDSEDTVYACGSDAQLVASPADRSADYCIEANSLFVSPVQTTLHCGRISQSEVQRGGFHSHSLRRPIEGDVVPFAVPVHRSVRDICLGKMAVRYLYMLHRLRI